MRRALEHVLTGAVLLFLGAGLALVALNGADREAVVRLANPQHQGVTR